MSLKNKVYSSYFIDKINKSNELYPAASLFGDNLEKNYNFLLPDLESQDLRTSLFGKEEVNAIVGEFNLSKHFSGRGPTGELIINEPIADVPEKIFEDFINLVRPEQNFIDDEDILTFVEKYGLLFFNPDTKLIKDKYHLEDLSIWKQEISLMHSLAKGYYFYDLAGFEMTKSAGLKGLESLFIIKKGKPHYFDDSYKHLHDIKPINYFIDDRLMFDEHGPYDKDAVPYEQYIVKLFIKILTPRLKGSSNRNLQEIQLQKKYQSRDFLWFNFEKDYKSLYTYIWTQFANFIQERGKLKICEKCKKYFVSKVVQRGRFCSDNCRVSKSREMEIWKLVEGEFKKKGYETHMTQSDYFSKLKLSMRADAALFNKKTNKMVGLLEFKYSDITNKSPKFKYALQQMMTYLKVMKKYYELNYGFIVNKNKQIFFIDLDKKIHGEEIKNIPHIEKLKQSEYKYKEK